MPVIIERIMDGAARPLNGPLTELHFASEFRPRRPILTARRGQSAADRGRLYAGLEITLMCQRILPDEAVPLAYLIAEQVRPW
ncbi:MAG: hypothetical protein U0401_00245 [Anaerolineae bacterium]